MASKRRCQLIKEAVPGVYNAGGERRIMVGFAGSLVPETQVASFRPAGYSMDAWHAMVRDHRVYNAALTFDYGDVEFLLPGVFGEAYDQDTADGITTFEYRLEESEENNIVTYTVEDGTLASCDRCTYGFIVALSLVQARDVDTVTGNVTILCKKPEADAIGVPMTGATAQNEIKKIILAAVTGDGVFPLPDTDLGAGGDLTVVPGDTNAELLTKIKAIAGYNDAGVTASGSSTDLGDTIVLTAPGNVGRLEDGLSVIRDLGALQVIDSIAFTPASSVSADLALHVQGSLDGIDGWVELGNTGAQTISVLETIVVTDENPYRYLRFYTPGAAEGGYHGYPVAFTVTIDGPDVSSGEYTITFAGALAQKQIGPWTTESEGYSSTTVQHGGDGTVPIPARAPILPQNMTARVADTVAALDDDAAKAVSRGMSFELGALTQPVWMNDENEDTFTGHVGGESPTQMASIELPTRSKDATTGLFIANPKHDLLLADTEGQPATARWFEERARHKNGVDGLDIQLFASARAAADITQNGNVRARNFMLAAVLAEEGYSVRVLLHKAAV